MNIQYEAQKKSGAAAAFLNLILPGAGYIYCGRWDLGILCLFILFAFFGFTYVILMPVGVIDGFFCAHRFNKKLAKELHEGGR